MPTIYAEWGFHGNPFTISPLQPNEIGSRLLIGPNDEISQLCCRLENGLKIRGLSIRVIAVFQISLFFKGFFRRRAASCRTIPREKRIQNGHGIGPFPNWLAYQVARIT